MYYSASRRLFQTGHKKRKCVLSGTLYTFICRAQKDDDRKKRRHLFPTQVSDPVYLCVYRKFDVSSLGGRPAIRAGLLVSTGYSGCSSCSFSWSTKWSKKENIFPNVDSGKFEVGELYEVAFDDSRNVRTCTAIDEHPQQRCQPSTRFLPHDSYTSAQTYKCGWP